jgi:hypothetical protein
MFNQYQSEAGFSLKANDGLTNSVPKTPKKQDTIFSENLIVAQYKKRMSIDTHIDTEWKIKAKIQVKKATRPKNTLYQKYFMAFPVNQKTRAVSQKSLKAKSQIAEALSKNKTGYYNKLIKQGDLSTPGYSRNKPSYPKVMSQTTIGAGFVDIPTSLLTIDPMKLKREILVLTELVKRDSVKSP